MSSEPMITAEVLPYLEVLEIKKRIEKLENESLGPYVLKVRLLIDFAESVGIWRCSLCKLNVGGICTGWRLSQEFANKIISLVGVDAVVQQDGVQRINLSKMPFVGAFCPIYTPKT